MSVASPTAVAPQLQGSLFATGDPAVDASAPFERVMLDDHCWVDRCPGWLHGGDDLFDHLHRCVAWEAHERPMYDRIVAVPRLTATAMADDTGVAPVLAEAGGLLGRRYRRRFDRIGYALYRDGADSVAWHGDRIGRLEAKPVIAVLSLGAARPFVLRPAGGGPSIRLVPGSGDLLVMGGHTQTRWEHAVPKVAHAGPRISVQFRYGPDDRVPATARRRYALATAGFRPRQVSRPG